MAYTYILYSETLSRYYVGSTDGTIEARLKKHLSNHKGFTGRVKDWILVYYEEYADKQEALTREMQIKAWKSRKQIEILISIKTVNGYAGSEHPDAIGRVFGSNLSPKG